MAADHVVVSIPLAVVTALQDDGQRWRGPETGTTHPFGLKILDFPNGWR
jgi:hypothetical protein